MNTIELNSEKLINLWKSACNWDLPIDCYDKTGSPDYPIYSIKLSKSISLIITLEDKHTIRLIFGDYLTYKKFEITSEQFESISLLHETSINEKQKKANQELIKKGEFELNVLLSNEEKIDLVNS